MAATPWAVLLCKFRDDLHEPRTRDFYEDLFTASGRGQQNIVDFFDDTSLGHVDLGSSQVFGWYTLTQARADYTGSGINPQGRQDLINWARAAATAAGVNLSAYHGVVASLNVPTDLFGGGGLVCCDPNSMHVSVLAQEIGHGFGLDHSRIEGSAADYQDRWDVMSTWDSCFMWSHPRWTLAGPGLNAANMHGRGWLDAGRTWVAPQRPLPTLGAPKGEEWHIELRPLHRSDLPGFLAVRVANRFFEFRVKERWDAAIPRPAVLCHEFAYNHSYLIPSILGSQDLTVGDEITWDPGHPWLTMRVSIMEIDAAGYTARLRVESIPMPRRRPVRGQRVSRGVQVDGGGWVIVGGRPVRVPPRSPLASVLQHIALHEMSHSAPNPRVRDSGQREALDAIHAHMTDLAAEHSRPSSPSPRIERRPKKPKAKKPRRPKPINSHRARRRR